KAQCHRMLKSLSFTSEPLQFGKQPAPPPFPPYETDENAIEFQSRPLARSGSVCAGVGAASSRRGTGDHLHRHNAAAVKARLPCGDGDSQSDVCYPRSEDADLDAGDLRTSKICRAGRTDQGTHTVGRTRRPDGAQ